MDAKKVKEARQLEMEYYDKMHVFDKVPIAQCWKRTGKAPLKARWVEIDKGKRYRSKWVAKQFKRSDSETDDIVEKRKLGKLGMKEQPLIGQILRFAETTRNRALAATANFLAIDRDIVYCAWELTRHVATPTTADWEKVVRLGRYLKNKPRVQLWYKIQETPCQLETFSETDWAGCRRTRRSTTGRYTVAGSRLIKMWCKTQAVVALS